MYQARTYGFEAGLIAAEGEELSFEADVFDTSKVDPVILLNTLESVQPSEARNVAL